MISLNLVFPKGSHNHNNPKMLIGVKAMRSSAVNRSPENNLPKLALSKIETVPSNSITIKDLLTTSVKLTKDSNSIVRTISPYQPCETSIYEEQSSAVSQPQPLTNQSDPTNELFDEIKYEQPWSYNDNRQQKVSLEIWLPEATRDENTNRTVTPESDIPELITPNNSRRSSDVKTIATTSIIDTETKSFDEFSSKCFESVIIPHVDEEQTYLSESLTTIDSDDSSFIKRIRRLHSAPRESKEILRFRTIELPKSAKNLFINTNSNYETNVIRKISNPSMVSKFIQKYTLMKKNRQLLPQVKSQFESLSNHPDLTNGILPLSTDYPTISVKKVLLNSARSTNDRLNTNTKVLDRCLSIRKPSHSNIYPHLRVFCLANQRQQDQSVLRATSAKKTDDTFRTLQRGKTVDIVLDIPSSIKPTNTIPHLIEKRSAFTHRSKHQPSGTSVIPNSVQHFHHSLTRTSVSNKYEF